MKNGLLRTAESSKPLKSMPSTPVSAWPSPEDCEAQVKAVEEQLLSEFHALQTQSLPTSSTHLSQLHHSYNFLLHSNRLKEGKLQSLRTQLSDYALSNTLRFDVHRSVTAGFTPRSLRENKLKDPITDLVLRIESREEGIESEAIEAERLRALYEKTQRAAAETRNKFLALQRRFALVLGKHEEVREIQDKAKYDLQHARAEAHLVAEQCRKDAQKRNDKLDILRREKRDIGNEADVIVKSLAEHLVQGHNSQTVASAHAKQLSQIYSQHLRNQSVRHHDTQSLDSLHSALATVRELVNRSESLSLEVEVREVKLEDVIGFAHQFEMKMSSLESQVQSLSEAKQDLEQRYLATRADLDLYQASQFQSTEILSRIEGKLHALALPHAADTYNDLKQLLETTLFDTDSEECARQDAFLASAFMTFHIAIRRIRNLMDYIAAQIQEEAGVKVSNSEWTKLLAISNCDRSEDPSDSESLQFYFKDTFEDLPDWGLEAEILTKEACDLLIIRLFSIDSRLKGDIREWKSSQLAIISENLHSLFLCKLISLSHDYFRDRLLGTCGGIRRIVVKIREKTEDLEGEVRSIPLTEAQLSTLLAFQIAGNPAEKAESESIKRTFEQKYRKLMLQQRTNQEKMILESTEPAYSTNSEEADYIDKQRKLAKSSGFCEKQTARTAVNKRYTGDGTHRGEELEAFAQVRTMDLRIRSIRASEKPVSGNTPTHRKFPSIHSSRSLRSIYSPRLSIRSPHAL